MVVLLRIRAERAAKVRRLLAVPCEAVEVREEVEVVEALPSRPLAHPGPQLAARFSEAAYPEIRDAQEAALPLTPALPEHVETAPALPVVLVEA